jgi:hypothetical protein
MPRTKQRGRRSRTRVTSVMKSAPSQPQTFKCNVIGCISDKSFTAVGLKMHQGKPGINHPKRTRTERVSCRSQELTAATPTDDINSGATTPSGLRVGMRAILESPPSDSAKEEITPQELIRAWSATLLPNQWQRQHMHSILTEHIVSGEYAKQRGAAQGSEAGKWMSGASQLALSQQLGVDITCRTVTTAWMAGRKLYYKELYALQVELWPTRKWEPQNVE